MNQSGSDDYEMKIALHEYISPQLRENAKILSFESSSFSSGEVQENLSLSGCLSEFKLREQARAVIVGAPTEHAEDGVQDLTGDGHQGLQFGFAACQQSLIKSAQMGIVAHRDESGHVQGAAQVAVAGSADARRFMDGTAGVAMSRIESTMRYPLAHAEARG